MPWIILVPLWIWGLGMHAANELYPTRNWYCFEPKVETHRLTGAVPWPFRRGSILGEPPAGTKNTCTDETYNGQWWYKP